MKLTEFLLARIAEDEAEQPCEWGCHDRVLAECETKRRIVEDYQGVTLRPMLGDNPIVKGFVSAMDGVLAALALPYADHPHYREEWRP